MFVFRMDKASFGLPQVKAFRSFAPMPSPFPLSFFLLHQDSSVMGEKKALSALFQYGVVLGFLGFLEGRYRGVRDVGLDEGAIRLILGCQSSFNKYCCDCCFFVCCN